MFHPKLILPVLSAATMTIAGCAHVTGGMAIPSPSTCVTGPFATVIDSVPSGDSETFTNQNTSILVVHGVGTSVFLQAQGTGTCIHIDGNIGAHSEIVVTGPRATLVITGAVDKTSTAVVQGPDTTLILRGVTEHSLPGASRDTIRVKNDTIQH